MKKDPQLLAAVEEMKKSPLTPRIRIDNIRYCYSDWTSRKFVLRDAFATNLDLCIEVKFSILPFEELFEIAPEEAQKATASFSMLLVSKDADIKGKEKKWLLLEQGSTFSFFPFSLTKEKITKYFVPTNPIEEIAQIALISNYFKIVDAKSHVLRSNIARAEKIAQQKLFELSFQTHNPRKVETLPIGEAGTIEEQIYFRSYARTIVQELFKEARERRKANKESQSYDAIINDVQKHVISKMKEILPSMTEWEKKLTISVFDELGKRAQKRHKVHKKAMERL